MRRGKSPMFVWCSEFNANLYFSYILTRTHASRTISHWFILLIVEIIALLFRPSMVSLLLLISYDQPSPFILISRKALCTCHGRTAAYARKFPNLYIPINPYINTRYSQTMGVNMTAYQIHYRTGCTLRKTNSGPCWRFLWSRGNR